MTEQQFAAWLEQIEAALEEILTSVHGMRVQVQVMAREFAKERARTTAQAPSKAA